MNNQNLKTRVLLPNVRLSYPFIWEPRAQFDGGKEKYSASLLIDKGDTQTMEKVQQAIKNAAQAGVAKFGGKVPDLNKIRTPLRDGDERDDEAYQGHYFINASSIQAPQIVDSNVDPIIDRNEVYAGCYANVTVNFYAYNVNGNRGIACGLGNIQKVADGEPLGGRTSASSDFAPLSTATDDFLA
ncbi:DUF2815 family protein [Eremococcus coleocola]|uniref:DUF2815 family protein n=1 Tax=Eremococcus coleocola TaxID=88132 RepID=UPI0003F9D639|nr:DUF2815 family protein [Eremococcus coleocola]